jgi:hypothetical protein
MELNPALVYVHKVEGEKIKGEIRIRKPSVVERLNYTEALGFEVDEHGKIDAAAVKKKPIKTLAKMIELSLAHYLSVALIRADGSEINDVDSLLVDDDAQRIATEVAQLVFNGFPPSKN